MSYYARANVLITNEKNKTKIPIRASRGLKWEKENVQAKRVYYDVPYEQTGDFHSDHYHTNNSSDVWLQLFE